jgi:CheY-like chemotaxis protein
MAGERVLVVDDDPDIARFIEVNLRAHGFEVHLASDGVEALEWVREMDPDLVLVDVMMPRMDGFQVVDRLRADPRTANVSIIMLTAKALTADKGWASPPVRTTTSPSRSIPWSWWPGRRGRSAGRGRCGPSLRSPGSPTTPGSRTRGSRVSAGPPPEEDRAQA